MRKPAFRRSAGQRGEGDAWDVASRDSGRGRREVRGHRTQNPVEEDPVASTEYQAARLDAGNPACGGE